MKLKRKKIILLAFALVIAGAVILRLTYFSPSKMSGRARTYYSQALTKVYTDPKAAEKLFRRAVRNDRSNSGYLWQLAVMQARNGNYKQAAKSYEALLKKTGNASLFLEAGQVYLSLNQQARAKDCFQKAIEADKGNLEAYYALADLLYRAGGEQEALALVQEGLKVNPKSEKLSAMLLKIQTKPR